MEHARIFAEGGGLSAPTAWSAAAFGWMVRTARERLARDGGGDGAVRAVILGAVTLDEPDEREQALRDAGAAEVRSCIVTDDGGGEAEAAAAIGRAHVLFLRGGDQGRYVRGWRNTSVFAAIRELAARGGVVAGTSAGCAVLGEVTYSAENDSLSATEALADPAHPDATLVRGFTGLAPGVLFDTHFTERGRLGRLPVLLGRSRELFEERRAVLGVGCDPRTAAAVGADGIARVMGEGTVTLLRETAGSRVRVGSGGPPTVTDLSCDVLLAGSAFRMADGAVVERPAEAARNGHGDVVEERSFEALTIDGAREGDGGLGVLRVRKVEAGAGEERRGAWESVSGEGRLPGSVVRTRAFSDDVWDSFAAVLGALAAGPGLVGWWVPEGCHLAVDEAGLVRVRADSTSSVLVLDSAGATYAGTRGAPGARAASHLEGARVHVLGPGWGLSLRTRGVVAPEAATGG
ncbi:MAG: Type 1 glutamine amidotransferase-like domain-containing protein [Planctomycetota bacterium]|nr:Type 1 glutamine amidotransferase-like domain-containing protein [Planctomycetota bacterium]